MLTDVASCFSLAVFCTIKLFHKAEMHLGDNLFKPKKLAVKETRKLSKKKHVAKNLIV